MDLTPIDPLFDLNQKTSSAPCSLESWYSPADDKRKTASTPGGKPDAPRDLLADAAVIRDIARAHAALGIWTLSAALERIADQTEQLHELITAGRSRRSGHAAPGSGPPHAAPRSSEAPHALP